MNTKFKILWFEDVAAWINSKELDVNGILQEYELEPQIVRNDGSNSKESDLRDYLTSNEFDLIAIDYTLMNGKKGDTIIKIIRNMDILTDILFYSGDYEAMISAMRAMNPPMEGVYSTPRKDYSTKVGKLIKKIVRRSEDLINLRGFVLDNASDFEVRIRALSKKIWQCLESDEAHKIETSMRSQIANKCKEMLRKTSDICTSECIFDGVVKDGRIFTNDDWLTVLNEMIKIMRLRQDSSLNGFPNDFRSEYTNKIAVYRNALGHSAAKDAEIEVNKKLVSIDDELHRKMRRYIREMESYMQKLEGIVSKAD
jgi:hypothetical protein